jgi:hypothetical protein
VLPDYEDYAYYLHDKDHTRKLEDLEIGQKGITEPYQTQRKQPPQIHHSKLSGIYLFDVAAKSIIHILNTQTLEIFNQNCRFFMDVVYYMEGSLQRCKL